MKAFLTGIKRWQKKKSLYYTEVFQETLFIGQNLDQSTMPALVSKQGLISMKKQNDFCEAP